MRNIKTLSINRYFFLILLSIIFLCTRTPNTGYDTPSYVSFSLVRPPLYPLFISLFKWAGQYQFQCVMWVQSTLTLFSLLYARNKLVNELDISDTLFFYVTLFTLITICFHFQFWYIQSEGLSFPFFIFAFFSCFTAFKQYSIHNITIFSGWVAILLLTRVQFYYLYGIFILLILWYMKNHRTKKTILIAIAVMMVSIIATSLIDRTYHLLVNKHFSGEPVSGTQVAIQPLYLAEKNASHYFKNKMDASLVQKIENAINQQGLKNDARLLQTFKVQHYEYAYQEYNRNYIAIQGIINHILSTVSVTQANTITNHITMVLVKHELQKNVFFYIWKVIIAFGGVPNFLFFLIFFPAILYVVYKKRTNQSLFVSLCIVFMFANALLVCAAETNAPPYFCYTQFLLYTLAALFADRICFK